MRWATKIVFSVFSQNSSKYQITHSKIQRNVKITKNKVIFTYPPCWTHQYRPAPAVAPSTIYV